MRRNVLSVLSAFINTLHGNCRYFFFFTHFVISNNGNSYIQSLMIELNVALVY